MGAHALLSRLNKVRETGNGRWIACCPAHADKRPSLSLRELDDGRVLVHCFVGCEVHDILAAVELDVDELYPPRPTTHARSVNRPWRAQDVVAALEHELTLALIFLAEIHEGREVVDRLRAGECRARIIRFLEELRHAS